MTDVTPCQAHSTVHACTSDMQPTVPTCGSSRCRAKPRPLFKLKTPALALASWLAAVPALAQPAPGTPPAPAAPETIEITGRAAPRGSEISTDLRGLPGAVTRIDALEIERMNVGRDYTDLLRRVPGINAYSFGQGDIGSPIKMRGFVGTGAHGGDVAVYIDGVPQNFPSANQGGPGMSDLSWLTPGMIERIEVIKGPFSALFGDQNRAGAVNIVTRSRSDNSAALTLGSFGTRRAALNLGHSATGFDALLVADLYRTDGWRANSRGERNNLFFKVSTVAGGGRWALRANTYEGDWNAPGYLSYAALLAGTVQPRDRDPASPPLFGDARRSALVLTRTPEGGNGWQFTAFAEDYEKRRANPAGATTRYNVQNDDRRVYGARVLNDLALGEQALLTLGSEFRLDRGTGINQRWDTLAGPGPNVNNAWDLDLLNYGAFAQAQWAPFAGLKLLGGLRADALRYDIANLKRPAASLKYSATVLTPRAGVVWAALPALELYANAGEGWRSPAERELSPPGALGPLGAAGGAPVSGLKPPKLRARDAGFKGRAGAFDYSAGLYHTTNKGEIREEPGGSGNFVNVGDTTRKGLEAELRWTSAAGLRISGSYGRVDGRVHNPPTAGQSLISGLPKHTYRLGLAHTLEAAGMRWLLNADAFHISGAPYYLGNSAQPLFSQAYTRYDLRATGERGPLSMTLAATLQPHRLASEQAGSTIDPRPPRDFSLTLAYRF